MTATTILSIVFNFVTREDHTYKAIWTFDISGHLELWVKDGDDHDTFVVRVVVIMTEHIVGHILKVITYHHLLLKIVHAALFEGVLQFKLITKIRLFVLE